MVKEAFSSYGFLACTIPLQGIQEFSIVFIAFTFEICDFSFFVRSMKRPRSSETGGVYDSSRSRRNTGDRPTKFSSFNAASASFPDRSSTPFSASRGGRGNGEAHRGGRGGGGDIFSNRSTDPRRGRRGRESSSGSRSFSSSAGHEEWNTKSGANEGNTRGSMHARMMTSTAMNDAYRPGVIPPSFSPDVRTTASSSSSTSATTSNNNKEAQGCITRTRPEETTGRGGGKVDATIAEKEASTSHASTHTPLREENMGKEEEATTPRREGGESRSLPPLRMVRGRAGEEANLRRSVVVVLEHCGLQLGKNGRLVDAYESSRSTTLSNPSLLWARPDIVHQCLLALFDSNLAYQQRLRVYLHVCRPSSKVIEVSPTLRPPRTYTRFKGLMTTLLRDGQVLARLPERPGGASSGQHTNTFSRDGRFSSPSSSSSSFPRGRGASSSFGNSRREGGGDGGGNGGALLRILPGSIAPIFPEGVPCIGLCNDLTTPVTTTTMLAKEAIDHPVEDAAHQGGLKHVYGFYCISCTEEGVTVRLEGSGGHRLSPSRGGGRFSSPKTSRKNDNDDDDDDDEDERRRREAEKEEVASSFPSSSPSTFVTSPSSVEMMQEVDYVTRTVSPSAYPIPAHVMCARLCEGFSALLR